MGPEPRTKTAAVRAHVLKLIDAGLAPHERLPTERELAGTFGYNRLTIRRALDQLVADGVVYRIQGAGTFVQNRRIEKSIELTSFSEDMLERGMAPASQLLSLGVEPAGVTVGYALGLSPMHDVVRVRRVRSGDGEPICLEDVRISQDLVPGLVEEGLDSSLYETLSARYGLQVENADEAIEATVLEPSQAELLGVPSFSPALRITRTSRDARGRAIEYAQSCYRGDKYSFQLTILRKQPAQGGTS